MDKEIEKMFEFFKADDFNLWELNEYLKKQEGIEALRKAFPEPMATIVKTIVQEVVEAMNWHNSEKSGAHEDIVELINKTDAKLRNHRHSLNESFSAKPEF